MKRIKTRLSEEIIDLLMPARILDDLGPDEFTILAGYMNAIQIQKGEILFHEGENGDYFCFVAEGQLEVIKKNEHNRYVLLTTLSPGNTIGEMAVLEQSPRSATVRARTPSLLVTLSRESFDRLMDDFPKTGLKIIRGITRLLSQNLRMTSATLADYMLPVT